MNNYTLKPIGYVNQLDSYQELVISNDYKPALLHVDKFSHIIIFWINNNVKDFFNKVSESNEYYRLLNGRNNYSFSPIRINVAKIKNIREKEGVIEIYNAITPQSTTIVDIKPYFPVEDRVKNCTIPDNLSSLPDFILDGLSNDVLVMLNSNKIIPSNNIDNNISIASCGMIKRNGGQCLIEFDSIRDGIFDYYEAFSHIQILWWFNHFEKENFRKTTQCNPPYEKAPRTGVFASRSPVRPNPIGLTTVRIIKIDKKKKILEISHTDAFDKTPIIDIRPYIPFLFRVKECKVPQWVDHWSEWVEESHASSSNTIDLQDSDFSRLREFSNDKEILNNNDYNIKNESKTSIENNDFIIVSGARENNLKNISVKIPKNKMTVITGLSGSGKSTLAFDTIYAESQRRFMDSISSTGRQFFKQFERPAVEQVLNLPPAIAVEQKTISRNSRSNVGTVSEISDYLRLLFARIGIRHCPKCGRAVEVQTIPEIVNLLSNLNQSFDIISLKNNKIKGSFTSKVKDNEKFINELKEIAKEITDKESGAFKVISNKDEFILHTRNHCYYCGISFFELTPSFFSSNNPESMCPDCDGLGAQMSVSPDLIVSSPEKSILDGASEWWGDLRKYLKKPTGNWMKGEVIALAQSMNVDLEKPWKDLDAEFKQKALFGTDGEIVSLTYKGSRGRSGDISRPVEGAVNCIKRLFRDSHGKGSNEFYLQFMDERKCPTCNGEQLSTEARFVTVAGKRFPEITFMSIDSLFEWLNNLPQQLSKKHFQISTEIIQNLTKKAQSLLNVGLHYLSLNRSIPTLSGGEAQRLRLATQLGCGLTNLLYILDEPSVGLHHSDHLKLINTMKQLRNAGNTIIVVEHDAKTMLEADYLIDMGPGAGINGGSIVAQGTPKEVMENPNSITGKYLKNEFLLGNKIKKKQKKLTNWVKLYGATKNNLKGVNASFPLGMFICVTGKSGSGKSSLITHTLSPILSYYYNHNVLLKGDYDKIEGIEQLDNIISITQEAIGRSPRSNPATYTGVFDEIRNVFASTEQAKSKKYSLNRFSFNSKEGRCEACEGEGRKKIEMNFMPDVWITCSECNGMRFIMETLQVTYKNKSIADVLDMDINEAIEFFSENNKILKILSTIQDVGLGYIKLGQSALTLSVGEAQRVKLAKELSKSDTGNTMYILDEPTTGLHFADIEHLLTLLHRITDSGNTVIVIEHSIDLIKNSDWVINLGPEGGENGGFITYEGVPDIAFLSSI